MAIDAIISLLTAVLFLLFFYGPWQATCTDWARQMIFERRDRLFDMAASGDLSFSSKEYKETREFLNGMIRFAHLLTWPYLLFLAKAVKKMGIRADHPNILALINNIDDPSVRKRVHHLVVESTISLVAMIALKSAIVAPLAFAMCAAAFGSKGFKYLVKQMQKNRVVEMLSKIIQIEAQFS
jgi:hypothetical protein